MLFAITGLLTTPAKTTQAKFPMTVESIMRGYALVGHAPRGLRWSDDATKIGFMWAKADGTQNPKYQPYTVSADGFGLQPGEIPKKPQPEWARGSTLGTETVYSKGGDLYLHDSFDDSTRQLTKNSGFNTNPVYARDGLSVVFHRNNDLFRYSTMNRKIVQLTQLKSASTLSPSVPVTVSSPEGFRAGPLTASPSGTHADVIFSSSPSTVKQAQIAHFITGSGYVELRPTYPRVGSPQEHSQLSIYNLKTGKETTVIPPQPGQVRPMAWAPDGRHGAVWAFSEDNKDAWLYCFDTATDQAKLVYTEHDNAWVGGTFDGSIDWFGDSSRMYFVSENSGYGNLYTIAADGSDLKNLTSGPFEVTNLIADEDRHRFVFVSSEGSPYDRHIDEVSMDGGPRRKLADYSAGDDSEFAISPDGTKIAVVRSKMNHPAELFVNNIQVTETPTKEWLSGPWIDAPIITYTSRDGVQVPAKIFKPKNWRRGGPGVVFVHGAGYLQNVFHGWAYYYREYMFHHLLMERGYVVLDVDYRASSGYGKAWRTAIYRHMGGHDLEDVVDGAKYLVKEFGADPNRLGVYGGSYGGFITFMAMFTTPDVFKSGAALRPVGDWANYHHGYTAPILNTPQDDPEAYKQSSPINFVDGLKGNLLICHGMVDSNVQFQDSVRVIEKLIELGKKNWSVAPYPVEDHSFVRPESWTDEYSRILDLFETTIGNHRRR